MQRIFALIVVIGLTSGLVGAFAVSKLSGTAGAAPPPPGPQQVREQNLDASGFIRVHEQGTANVNLTNASVPVSGTVNVGNLRAVQDVNVISQASESGRLIELGTVSSPGGYVTLPLVDVSDCSGMLAMARVTHSSGLYFTGEAFTSPDGSTRILTANNTVTSISPQGAPDGFSVTSGVITSVHRYISPRVYNGGPTADVTAWIWCVP